MPSKATARVDCRWSSLTQKQTRRKGSTGLRGVHLTSLAISVEASLRLYSFEKRVQFQRDRKILFMNLKERKEILIYSENLTSFHRSYQRERENFIYEFGFLLRSLQLISELKISPQHCSFCPNFSTIDSAPVISPCHLLFVIYFVITKKLCKCFCKACLAQLQTRCVCEQGNRDYRRRVWQVNAILQATELGQTDYFYNRLDQRM